MTAEAVSISIRWPVPLPLSANGCGNDAVPSRLACPNCGGTASKGFVLQASAVFAGRPIDHTWLGCPDCGCAFVADPLAFDYVSEGEPPRPVIAFYTQQSAGIAQIVQTLARVRRPAGSRFLDVGCGFGFGLDFAIAMRGWSGQGTDPSGLAQAGRVQLGVPIAHRYLGLQDATGDADVIMASEVLEHLRRPGEFIGLLRSALVPGGVLIVTTPDAGTLRPDAPESWVIPALSLGTHLVLQTPHSLETLLRRAGFAHVAVRPNGFSLIAYASDLELELVEDPAALAAEYGAYLLRRLKISVPGSDLWLGFAGRCLARALEAQDWNGFDQLFDALAEQIGRRFGFTPDRPETLPDFSAIGSPDAWAEQAPFNLAVLLHARLAARLQRGVPMVELLPLFQAVTAAAAGTRRVLQMMNADDPAIEHIEALSPGLAVRDMVMQAVNAGDFELAHQTLAKFPTIAIEPDPAVELTEADRNVLFALGMLDLQPGGDLARAARRFARARSLGIAETPAPHDQRFMSALQGELQAAELLGDHASEARLYASLAAMPAEQFVPAELRRMQAMYARRSSLVGRLRHGLRTRLPLLARLVRGG